MHQGHCYAQADELTSSLACYIAGWRQITRDTKAYLYMFIDTAYLLCGPAHAVVPARCVYEFEEIKKAPKQDRPATATVGENAINS